LSQSAGVKEVLHGKPQNNEKYCVTPQGNVGKNRGVTTWQQKDSRTKVG